MVHVARRFIPTGLIIASGADVMVGAGDVTAARIAFVDAGIDLVAVLLQQRIELEKLAGERRVHRDVEAICCFTVTIMLLPLASTARSGLRPRKLCVLLDVGAAKLKV